MSSATIARLREPDGARRGLTRWDPSSVFLLKSLLYPTVATASLAFSLWVCGAAFRHEYFLLAVLAFLGTSEVLDTAPLAYRASRAVLRDGLVPIALQWLVVVGFIWALLEISDLAAHFDERVLLTWAAVTPVTLWSSRLCAQLLFQTVAAPRLPVRKAAIVGSTPLGRLLERKLRDEPSLRIDVLGFFDDPPQGADAVERPEHLLGEPADLPRFVLEHEVGLVYITWPMARESRILALLESLRDSTVSVYFVPDVSVASLIQGRVDLIGGMPVVGVCESPFFGIRGLVKRACDVFIASAALVLAAPLMLAAAIGVQLTTPGGVIFTQRRYGLDGREILVYKFRSMTVSEDGDHTYTQVIRNDSRVTPFGSFIRKTSIDELPQLFNVLEGSMSLVGPRPHAIAVNEQYRKLISGYMLRHKVKPGITGWAQVNGARGGDDLPSMTRRVELDLEYLRNWSLGLDIAILLKTATLLFGDRRAY
jgi:putative colanic acid biosynthesis UDP-glucose lipid carrier transferase